MIQSHELTDEHRKTLASLSSAPPSPPRLSVAERSGAMFPPEHRGVIPVGSTHMASGSFVASSPPRSARSRLGNSGDLVHHSSLLGPQHSGPFHSAPLQSESEGPAAAPLPAPPQGLNLPSAAVMADSVALSLRTIAEQQLVIKSLQDLVQATKSRVAYLEELNRALVKEKGVQQEVPPLLMEELDTLRSTNVQLLQRTSLLMEEKSLLEEELESSKVALDDLNGRFQKQLLHDQELQQQEERWKQQTALLRLSETERKKLQIENSELREDLDRSAFEKKRWRALVQTLSCRLHPSLNSHIEKHIHTMVMEEERRYQAAVQERKARQAAFLAEVEAIAAKAAVENGSAAFASSSPSDTGTGGEGRSTQDDYPLPRRLSSDSPSGFSSQPFSELNSMDLLAVWQKPKDPYSPTSLSNPQAGESGDTSKSESTFRGTLPSVPFHQEEAVPNRRPGQPAVGLFQEDPRYDFGPGTLPVQMVLQARSEGKSNVRRGIGASGGPLATKSFSQLLQPDERKRKKQEEGRKAKHLVPI